MSAVLFKNICKILVGTYRTVCLRRLHTPRVVVPYAAGGFTFLGPRLVDLLDDLVVNPHAWREFRPQVYQVGCPRTEPALIVNCFKHVFKSVGIMNERDARCTYDIRVVEMSLESIRTTCQKVEKGVN